MSEPLHVHGACHCSAVAYEATVDPARTTICHCTDCQNLTGSAYRVTVGARMQDFHLIRGTPRVYVKTADSGNRRAHAFCGDCGSHLYAHPAVDDPQTVGLRVGSLRERGRLVPKKRIWCQSALAWSQDLGGMAVIDHE